MKDNNLITLDKICEMLHISIATGKNWLKLNKITPQKKIDDKPYFTINYAEKLVKTITDRESIYLKSRRNKKFASGTKLYKSYIDLPSKNYEEAEKLQNYIETIKINLQESDIAQIIGHQAKELFKQIFKSDYKLYEYLSDELEKSDITEDKYPELKKFKFYYEPEQDILGLIYMSLKNISTKKSQGAYFTPSRIVKKLTSAAFTNYKKGKVIDPCCGSGNFILNLPAKISPEDIYAGDTDPISVKIARINFAIKYKIHDKEFLYNHIKISDFLKEPQNIKYDYIIGNPPWGCEFEKAQMQVLRKKFKTAQGTNIESYDVITEHALNKLNNNGMLAFVLPEAILNVKSHKMIRKIIRCANSIKYLEYLGESFDGVQCPSIILGIYKNNMPLNTKSMHVKDGNREFIINTVRKINDDIFNFRCDDNEYKILEQIENIPNKVTLKSNAQFALGIVTGNNAKYLSKTKNTYNEIVLKGTDIEKFKINKPSNYIDYRPNEFQQCAPAEAYRAKEKLVYKFISKKLVFAYDNKQILTLNSCNILIPQIKGLNIKYILGILNSSVAQFYYEKKFNSVKILRSHLEQIPIPCVEPEMQKPLIEMVNKYINKNDKSLLAAIDSYCEKLYNLQRDTIIIGAN